MEEFKLHLALSQVLPLESTTLPCPCLYVSSKGKPEDRHCVGSPWTCALLTSLKRFLNCSRASFPGKLVLYSLKEIRITPTPAPHSTHKSSFLPHFPGARLNKNVWPSQGSNKTAHAQFLWFIHSSISSADTLNNGCKKAAQHPASIHSTQDSTSYYLNYFYVWIITSVFHQKHSFSHHTHVKLLFYSFSSNTGQTSRLFYLIQNTKDPNSHYRHPGYTINTQKYTNKPKQKSFRD